MNWVPRWRERGFSLREWYLQVNKKYTHVTLAYSLFTHKDWTCYDRLQWPLLQMMGMLWRELSRRHNSELLVLLDPEWGETSHGEGSVIVVEPQVNVVRNLFPGSVHFIGLSTLGRIPWYQQRVKIQESARGLVRQDTKITEPWLVAMSTLSAHDSGKGMEFTVQGPIPSIWKGDCGQPRKSDPCPQLWQEMLIAGSAPHKQHISSNWLDCTHQEGYYTSHTLSCKLYNILSIYLSATHPQVMTSASTRAAKDPESHSWRKCL